MGTGTVGSGHHSHQTALGTKGLSDLLLNGYDHGLRFFDSADSYGSHPHVAEALKHVARDKVTVLTKTWARDPASARADLDRFRRELGTDYIDVCLMHCLTEGDWTERYKGVMDVLSEAKQKGIIRAHGCSCHSIDANDALLFGFGENVHDAFVALGPITFGEAMHEAHVYIIGAELAAECIAIGAGGSGGASPRSLEIWAPSSGVAGVSTRTCEAAV